MLKQQARTVATGLRVLDLLLLAAAFPLAYWIRDGLLGEQFTGLYPIHRYWTLLLVSLPVWVIAAGLTRVYGRYRTTPLLAEIVRIGQATVLSGVTLAAVGFLSRQYDVSRLLVAIYVALGFSFLAANRIALRLTAHAARRRGYNTRKFAVVGSGPFARWVADSILDHPGWGYTFAGFVGDGGAETASDRPLLGTLPELGNLLERHVLDEVIFAVPRDRLEEIENAVLLCEEQGVGTKVCLNFFPHRIAKMSLEDLDGLPVLGFSTTPSDSAALFVKRAIDMVGSAVALVILSPLFALLAVAIKLDSPGPVFFRQRRVGLNGREFTLVKFRSMITGAENQLAALRQKNEMAGPVFKMRDDPRVTRVGRLLRRASLDELPQLWNVFRGEMSLVGPRPPLPLEVQAYQRWQRRRLSVKPGLTCVWQVSGRNEIDFDRWMELDLHYIDTWSLWTDFKIILKTIPVVLMGRGAR
jgi:exopolysaccharide biosynthesis polyprenyl glycosylphosphotransferase